MASTRSPGYRLAFDIGGTFTDLSLLDNRTGSITVYKTLTSLDDPARAAMAGIRTLIQRAGISGEMITNVIHGTTLVTNALIERKGVRVGLITTKGFRDTLQLREQARYDIYELTPRYPEPLVPRYLRIGIAERTDRLGNIVEEIAPSDIAAAIDEMRAEVEKDGDKELASLAICFLHSYRNPDNERAAARIVRELWPDVDLSLSSEVAPEIREYERTSTTVANAYVRPITREYLRGISESLTNLGYTEDLYIMMSSGGIATLDVATEFPVRLIESGPAGGAIGAAYYGALCGHPNLVSFDMGGTTAKICLIEEGRPTVSHQLEVARVHRFKKGSGLPIQFPSVEMIEIGAGGGSIAWVDELGLLKVGPESAGADPGPACYANGGRLPTVTDAALVLGYLNPENFLGGAMSLDKSLAEDAIVETVGRPLDLSLIEAAWGIHQLVVENMAAAARLHIIERGQDPRRFALLAFGGAGPIHAAEVARLLKQRQIIYPLAAGVLSSIGFLVAPVSFEFSRSEPQLLDSIDWNAFHETVVDLEHQGRGLVEEAGVPAEGVSVERWAEARFAGQINEISIPLPLGRLDESASDVVLKAFNEAYRELYGHLPESIPVEIVTCRAVAKGHLSTANIEKRPLTGATSDPPPQGVRPVYWFEAGAFVDTAVFDRYLLEPGVRIEGPAVVEERESTVLIPVGWTATVDDYRNLIATSSDPGVQ